jgi:hypothetical protein
VLYGKGGGRDDGRGRNWYGVDGGRCCKCVGPTAEGVTARVARVVAVAAAGVTTSAVWTAISETASGVVFTLWV